MTTARYFVASVPHSIEFYVTHLGFTVQQQWGDAFAIIGRDGLSLWLSGPDTSAAQPMPNGDVPKPGGWNRIVLTLDDLASRVAAMREAGVTFRNEIVSGPGGSQILAQDPDGNPIELFEPRSK